MYYFPLLIFLGVVFLNILSIRGDYRDDQIKLLEAFGKAGILGYKKVSGKKVTIKLPKNLQKEYTDMMQMNCQGEGKKRKELIDKQIDLKLVGWATVYQRKPSGTLLHNIEFDHIPPGSAHPFDKGHLFEEAFKQQAPTLAISNFDHRSALWKQCSTASGDTRIMRKYKNFVEQGNHMCALFANIFCIKDIEKHISNIEHVSETPAFERYKDGFKSLINLHYQFGRENNKALKFQVKVSSAYCEIKERPESDADTGCKPENLIKEDTDWYCKNVGKRFNKCNGHERNLKKTEYDMLNEWIAGTKSDNDLLGACDLDRNGWQDLFPKIEWAYKPADDTNLAGSDGACERYERKWMIGPEEKIEEESNEESKEEEKKEEEEEEEEKKDEEEEKESEKSEGGKMVDEASGGSHSENMDLDK